MPVVVPVIEVAGEGMGAGGTGGVPPPLVVEVEEAAEKVAVCGVTCSGILVPIEVSLL